MDSLILLLFCLALGLIFRQSKIFPDKAYLSLNSFVIYAALPALILEKIPVISFTGGILMPVLMPWLLFGVAILFFAWLGPYLGWSRKTIGCLTLTCGLGNTSFIGIPVMQMLWDEPGVQIALLADQPGSFAALATVGIGVASYYAAGKTSAKELLLRVLRFPPFITFLFALLLKLVGWTMPDIFSYTLHRLGQTLVPLALVSVGMQLNPSWPGEEWKKMAWGLGYKLLLAPALIFGLYVGLLGKHNLMSYGSVMEAGMGPMITAAIIATNFGLNPRLVGRMVGFGIPLSFLTLVLWYYLLQLAGA